jgi:hypothetical protein
VSHLPDFPHVLYLAGRKFGSSDSPELTWAMNTVVPANVAERFRESRIVVFSTGNVYAPRAVEAGGVEAGGVEARGSRETDPPAPVGEYAQSCLGRERVFEYFSNRHGVRCLFFRLNYAVDLRYGVLVDIARTVYAGEPVDLAVPAFNAIWQRDANSYALRALAHCGTPPRILNSPVWRRLRATQPSSRGALRASCRFQGSPGPGGAFERCLAVAAAPWGRPRYTARLMDLVAEWVAAGLEFEQAYAFRVADGKF